MKWRSIRDNYVRYKKKMSESSSRCGGGFEVKPFRSYVHAKQLRFLNNTLKLEAQIATTAAEATAATTTPTANTNIGYIHPMDVVETQVVTVETALDNTNPEPEDNDTTTCSYSLPTKRPRNSSYLIPAAAATNSHPSVNRSLSLSLEDKLSKFMDEHKPREFDEDMSFFESLLPSVKILTNDEKLEFRIKILQLLQGIKRRRENLPVENIFINDDVKIKEEL